MPQLVGIEQGKALVRLQKAGLSAQVFNDYSEAYPKGKVIGQLPPPNAGLSAGAEAVLMVSSGRSGSPVRPVLLPVVVDQSQADAVDAVQTASLSPQVVHESSATVPAGVVIAQLPSHASLANAPSPRPAWWVWAAAAAVIVTALIVAVFLLQPAAQVQVPDLIGLTQPQAEQVLTAAGLKLGSVEQTRTDEVVEGEIVSQEPGAGMTVRKGGSVSIVIAGTRPLIAVPDVRKLNQADATRALRDAGLQVSVTRGPSSTVEKGLVIEQTPKAGQQVPEGTTVGIVISEGRQVTNVLIPDVTGLIRSDAEKTLNDTGLKILTAENPSEDVAVDVVISQLPAAGESVAPGTTVGIVISTGAPTAGVIEVPNVTGLTLAEAQQIVSDAGFTGLPLAASGTGKPANQVVAQTPAAGDMAQGGSTVVLFYSTGP
jgi:beta-lactam-binding protein with PASTA domain